MLGVKPCSRPAAKARYAVMSQLAATASLDVSTANAEATGNVGERNVTSQHYKWTPRKFCQSVSLFALAAATEVGGGWLVWQSIRTGRPWWWALLGGLTLIFYGFVPTLQPVDHFGRTFAVYGGFFIVYSYGWGWLLDNERPDTGQYSLQCQTHDLAYAVMRDGFQ